jgi:hypothetical protein
MHEERTEALRTDAICLFEKGDFEAVAEMILAAGVSAKDDYELQSHLGASLSKLGRHEEALEAFKTALALRPSSAHTYYNLGVQLIKMGQIDEGRPLILEAKRIDPKHAGAVALIDIIGEDKQEDFEVKMDWERTAGAIDWNADYLISPEVVEGVPEEEPQEEEQDLGDRIKILSDTVKIPPPRKPPEFTPIIGAMVFLIIACSLFYLINNAPDQAEQSVMNLIKATERGDCKLVRELIYIEYTPEIESVLATENRTKEQYLDEIVRSLIEEKKNPDNGKSSFKFLGSKIKGDDAEVTTRESVVTPEGKGVSFDLTYSMKRQNGRWKIDLMKTYHNNSILLQKAAR